LPKVGFKSRKAMFTAEVRLNELNGLQADVIDVQTLIDSNIVPVFTKTVKVIKSGEISRAVTVKGLKVTGGALASIQAAGGKAEE
jgi:large subunit ribosomal protein L15